MSLKYRDKNGAEHVLAGLTPGGDIEYGAVATRQGTVTIPSLAANTLTTTEITFSESMPDNDYEVTFTVSSLNGPQGGNTSFMPFSKTPNGFIVAGYNGNSAVVEGTKLMWKAFKLYTVADAEALYSTVQDIEAMIPSSASSTNKFATADDLRTETRTLDRRLDDVEDVIPSSASIINKLATKEEVEEAMENAGLQVCSEVPSSPTDKDVMLYIGEETGFTKGGIYQYTADPGAWVLISTADVDLSKYETSWTGTKAEWDALPANEKKQYKIANITDDVIGGEVADVVVDGDMRPVTSNAVFEHAPIRIKEYVFTAEQASTLCNITEDNGFIAFGYVKSSRFPYNVSIPWNTEVTAFVNTSSKQINLNITTQNYYGTAHIFIGSVV